MSHPAKKTLLTSPIPQVHNSGKNTLSSQIKLLYSKLKETDVNDKEDTPKNTNRKFTVQLGPSGEVYVIFLDTVYIYDWLPLTGEFSPYSLYLKHTVHYDTTKISPLSYNRKLNTFKVVSTKNNLSEIYDSQGTKINALANNHQDTINCRPVDSHYFVICNTTTNNTNIYKQNTKVMTIPTMTFDIKGDFLIYKTTNKQTTTKLSISSNKNLSTKILNAMVDIVSDLKVGSTDYKELIIDAYNTITKHTEYAECVDLVDSKTLFRVGLPQGISNLALSPNNLEFVSVSSRGDEILKWDFSQLQSAKHIILTDTHSRGQTATTVNSLQLNNNNILCLNSQSGSVHYFGNNGWKLSKFGAKNAQFVKTYFIKDFIVILDSNEDLFIANTDGKIIAYIDMNQIGDPKIEEAVKSKTETVTQNQTTSYNSRGNNAGYNSGYNNYSSNYNSGYSSGYNSGYNAKTSTTSTKQTTEKNTQKATAETTTQLRWNYQHMEIDVDTCGPYPFAFRNSHFTFTKLPDQESITPDLFTSL